MILHRLLAGRLVAATFQMSLDHISPNITQRPALQRTVVPNMWSQRLHLTWRPALTNLAIKCLKTDEMPEQTSLPQVASLISASSVLTFFMYIFYSKPCACCNHCKLYQALLFQIETCTPFCKSFFFFELRKAMKGPIYVSYFGIVAADCVWA